MKFAAPSDLSMKTESRPRPFGSGRLSLWRLVQEIALARRHEKLGTASGSALVRDGLDPVISHASSDGMVLTFGQIARFRIGFDDQTVSLIAAHPEADQNTVDHLVDDHIAPRIIAAGGHLVVHSSAVVIDGRMAVFLGQTGSGKSTLAASLHADGHRLVGDDAVVIGEADGAFEGEPVYQSLRLYRESIEQVFVGKIATSAMAFYSDKLHVSAANMSGAPAQQVPIGAIYILADGETGVTLNRVAPADACMALVEHSFALDPLDPAAATQRMAQAARVAAAIPCYELSYPYDFGLLGEARMQVINSLATLTNTA